MEKEAKKEGMPDNFKWSGEADLKLLKKKFDNRFGDISIFVNAKTERKVFMKERRFSDRTALESEYRLALARLKLQHPSILQMLGYSVSTEKGLCSTNYYLRTFFVYFERDLKSEFAKRLTKKKAFSDAELRTVVEHAQQALLQTHVNGLVHGDVRPEMIGIIKNPSRTQVVQAVLLDRLHDNSTPSQLQTKRMVNKQPLFVSPELYAYVNSKDKSRAMYGRQKNDFFGLGMCMLHVGINQRQKLQKMYGPKGAFDRQMLGQSMEQFDRAHGLDPSLCRTVAECLGLQKAPVITEERKFMESSEKTLVQPSNGQPAYEQVKTKKAEFAKKSNEQQWRQVSSWRTVKTEFIELPAQQETIGVRRVEVQGQPIETIGVERVAVQGQPIETMEVKRLAVQGQPIEIIGVAMQGQPIEVNAEVKGRPGPG